MTDQMANDQDTPSKRQRQDDSVQLANDQDDSKLAENAIVVVEANAKPTNDATILPVAPQLADSAAATADTTPAAEDTMPTAQSTTAATIEGNPAAIEGETPTTEASSAPKQEESYVIRRGHPSESPRWYTQSYLVFLALRKHPDHCMPRGQIIRAALELDLAISKERSLPRAFKGKTPQNSCSAVLTNNSERLFIPFKPEGSRSTWFRLAYEPGSFDSAYKAYQQWLVKLIAHDWLYCFGKPTEAGLEKRAIFMAEQKALIAQENKRIREEKRTEEARAAAAALKQQAMDASVKQEHAELDVKEPLPLFDMQSDTPKTPVDVNDKENTQLAPAQGHDEHQGTLQGTLQAIDDANTPTNDDNTKDTMKTGTNGKLSPLPSPQASQQEPVAPKTTKQVRNKKKKGSATSSPASTPPSASSSIEPQPEKRVEKPPEMPHFEFALEDLDLREVPTSLDDILYEAESKIPGAGMGLFAKRDLPFNTPLGFYFGMPMTEDEFDSIKDGVGRSSEYSIRYRKTILDATDNNGDPWPDPANPDKRLCPFHYMNEAKDRNKANIEFVEGHQINQVICWTKKTIPKGTELLAYYGSEVDRHWSHS
ncbi:hypothetical protein BC940DRAFT_335234 [Gongronella butleri]|nr:hypothetical protein BC940DRAFT_335234 [Gongronella butleri]